MANEYDGTLQLDQVGFAYSGAGGPFQIQTWPRYAYHATEAPRTVSSKEEFEALEPDGWSLQYIKKDYPKMKFSTSGETVVVNTPEEEAALEGTWTDTPTDPGAPIDQARSHSFTLQQKAEAIRDGRRLSLDYVQLNQSLDCHADNAPMRAISPTDVPRPQFHPVETADQIRQRREQEDEARKKRQAEGKKQPNDERNKDK
jgi:hypothetical protein